VIEKLSPNLGKPYVGSLGSGLYEIRSKGKEGIGRSLYCTVKGQRSHHSPFIYQKNTKDAEESA
jgi:phage-related protein